MKVKQFYSPGEFAGITGLALRTVYKMIKRGDVESLQKTPKCKHLIPQYEIPTYLRKETK